MLDAAFREVEREVEASVRQRGDVGCIEVARRVIGIAQDTGGGVLERNIDALLDNDGAVRIDLLGKQAESLDHVGVVVVDVEVVGVGGRHHGDMGIQLEERTVEFVGLGHEYGVLAQQQVGIVVLGNAAQEGVAAFAGLCEDVGQQGAGGRLAVGARHGEALLPARDLSQSLRSLAVGVAVAADVLQFTEIVGNGGGIDDEGMFDVLRDGVDVVLIVDGDAFLLQLVRQR